MYRYPNGTSKYRRSLKDSKYPTPNERMRKRGVAMEIEANSQQELARIEYQKKHPTEFYGPKMKIVLAAVLMYNDRIKKGTIKEDKEDAKQTYVRECLISQGFSLGEEEQLKRKRDAYIRKYNNDSIRWEFWYEEELEKSIRAEIETLIGKVEEDLEIEKANGDGVQGTDGNR